MPEVVLTRGYSAVVDDEDYDRVMELNWIASPYVSESTGEITIVYARAAVYKPDGRLTTVLMHRYILQVSGFQNKVDHINHNGLDNRRENLRVCSNRENISNGRHRNTYGGKPTSSQYKGVCFNKRSGKWQADIRTGGGKRRYLGLHATEVEAAMAYDRAAVEVHGEFALLNFPEGTI